VRSGVRSVFAAVTFLTAIPLGRWAAVAPRHLESGALLFPLVGALVGALVATTAWGASLAFPPMVAGVIGVACGILVTGALHLDGLADVADGVGAALSGGDPAEAMRDPRLGVFGGTALVLDLLLKISLVAALVEGGTFPTEVVAAGALARVAPIALASALPYVGPRHTWTRAVGWRTCVGASLLAVAIGVVAVGAAFTPMIIVAAAGTAIVGRWAAVRLGGTTGDVFGAAVEVSETLALAVAVALALA
jgi:adenosylcobinamide-GDP ribazoletransferase